MPQSPSAYDPFENPDAALRRRAEVLRAMRDDGAISARPLPRRSAHAAQAPSGRERSNRRSYLTDWIAAQLIDRYGAERVRRGGLRVYTTLDAQLQREAEQAITKTLDHDGDPAGRAGLDRPEDRRDPRDGRRPDRAPARVQHRRARAERQAGSTFKTFVLTEAVQRGINPWATKYLSAPFLGPRDWHVQTYEHTYSGRIPLSQATLESDNTVYARLTLDMGPARIAKLAHDMGVQTPAQGDPADRPRRDPDQPARPRRRVLHARRERGQAHAAADRARRLPGEPDRRAEQRPSSRVLDGKVAAQVTKVLVANVQGGTGTAAQLPDRPVAGKTGTTDSYADAWFAGYVPQLATVVWVGYPDRERPMRDVHGIQVAGGTFPAADLAHVHDGRARRQAGAAVRRPGRAGVPALVRPLPVRAHRSGCAAREQLPAEEDQAEGADGHGAHRSRRRRRRRRPPLTAPPPTAPPPDDVPDADDRADHDRLRAAVGPEDGAGREEGRRQVAERLPGRGRGRQRHRPGGRASTTRR